MMTKARNRRLAVFMSLAALVTILSAVPVSAGQALPADSRRLDQLSRVTEDQAKFGDAVHDLLSALELGDDRNADSDDDENQDENQDGENDQSGAEGRCETIATSSGTRRQLRGEYRM